MNDKVEQVFLQIVANVTYGGDIKYVLENKEEDRFFEAIGADSLEVVEIVMALEDTFDINITDEETEVRRHCQGEMDKRGKTLKDSSSSHDPKVLPSISFLMPFPKSMSKVPVPPGEGGSLSASERMEQKSAPSLA